MKIRVGDKTVLSTNTKKSDDDKIDVIKIFRNKSSLLLIGAVLIIAFLSFHIRTLNIHLLGNNVLALDPWVFHRYTLSVVENGSIPTIDYMRNFPVGYITDKESIIIPHILAYVYKFLNMFNSDITVMKIVQYYPPVATFLSTIMLFLLASKLFNRKVGLIAALTLAVAPGFLFRTVAGFADKEAMAMLFIFSTLYFYVSSIKAKDFRKTAVFAALAGLFTGLTAMSWGGFVFPIYGISGYMLVLVLIDKGRKKDLITQFFWLALLTVFDLFTGRTVVRQLASQMGILGFIALFIRIYLYPWINKKFKDVDKIPPGILVVSLAMIIGVIGSVIVFSPSYAVNMIKSVSVYLTDPLGGGRAMGQSVSENQQPFFDPDWKGRIGEYYFYIIFAGAVLLFHNTVRTVYKKDWEALLKLTLPYTVFLFIVVFSRFRLNDPVTAFLEPIYQPAYIILIAWLGLVFLTDWRKGRDFKKITNASLLLLVWFTVLLIAARGAVRLIFPFIPAAVIVGSYLFVKLYEIVRDNVKDNFYKYISYTIIAGIAFVLIINPIDLKFGKLQVTSYYNQIHSMAPGFGPSVFGDWQEGFDWIKNNTPEDAIFVHWWDYGYWIQSLSNRTTVTDGGNARIDWNYLMGRHFFGGSTLEEVHDVLRELSSPDYFYVVSDDVGKFYQMERIGERNTYYTMLMIEKTDVNTLPGSNATEFPNMVIYKPSSNAVVVKEDFTVNGKLFAQGETFVLNVFIPYSDGGNIAMPLAAVYNTMYGQALLPVNGLCQHDQGCFQVNSGGVPAYFLMIQNGAIWVPQKAGQMFMTQQYLLNRTIPGFELVWESSAPLDDMRTIVSGRQNVRVYKINYSAMEHAISEGYTWT